MPTSGEGALHNHGLPCARGRQRMTCPHLFRARARRMVVTLALGLAVAVRAMEGVKAVRLG